MANKQFIGPANRAFTSNGFPAPGATLSLYLSGTLTPANFYADDALTTSLGPTLTANGAGRFEDAAYQDEFAAFRVIYRDKEGVQLDDIDPFFFGYEGPRGPQGIAGDVAKVATVADLAATAVGGLTGLTRYLYQTGRAGIFVWSTDDLSAFVSADTAQGIYVAPASGLGVATDGSDGAWVRQVSGKIDPKWFGVVSTTSATYDSGLATANTTAWLAMYSCLRARSFDAGVHRTIEAIRFTDDLFYQFSTTLDITDGSLDIEGVGPPTDTGGTTIMVVGATVFRTQAYNTQGDVGVRAGAQGGDRSRLANMRLYGAYSGVESESHGVHARSTVTLENIIVLGMPGDGIYSNAVAGGGAGSPGGPAEGNANLSRVYNCRVIQCRNGFITDGSDTNAWVVMGLDASSNRASGIADNSFLGNYFFGCHTASNGWEGAADSIPTACSYNSNRYYVRLGQAVGASTNAPSGDTTDNTWWGYIGAGGTFSGIAEWVSGTTFREGGAYKNDDPNARSTFVACYSESDQNPSQFWPQALMVGGLPASGVVGGTFITSVDDALTCQKINAQTRLDALRAVIGTEVGGYVGSGSHRSQIVATGSETPLVLIGGKAYQEIWKDATPTRALSIGHGYSGISITDDFIVARYNAGWAEMARWVTASNDLLNQGNVILNPLTAGTFTANGQMTFHLTTNTSLDIVVKGTDGVTRKASLTLA